MIACLFRFVNQDSKPTGYFGFACAANKKELFWEIDQYGDPYSVELSTTTSGSYCLKQLSDVPFSDDQETSEHETDGVYFDGIKKWRKPNWPKDL